jgi:hypothetical protein
VGILFLLPISLGCTLVDSYSHEQSRIPFLLSWRQTAVKQCGKFANFTIKERQSLPAIKATLLAIFAHPLEKVKISNN